MAFEKKKKYGVINNIPFEIQEEIIKRVVPVKSLIRFRSVSKQWKSLIDSPEFIAHHTLYLQTQPQHLLVSYVEDYKRKYVSFVDDDSFPRNRFDHTLSTCFGQSSKRSMIGCSHGLVCLLFNIGRLYPFKMYLLVIWNPSVRKCVSINIPKNKSSFGFGVCPKTGDPKIVQITKDWKAAVFSVSSRVWRSVPLNLPRRGALSLSDQVVIDGVIYWALYDSNDIRVILFDVTSEEFEEVELPKSPKGFKAEGIFKLNDCPVVLYYPTTWVAGRKDCYGWKVSKNGASKSYFTKLFSFNAQACHSLRCRDKVVGFRKNGQPIIERVTEITEYKRYGTTMIVYNLNRNVLEVYDQQAQGYNGLGIRGSQFQITSYMESLLLLKQLDSIIE